MSDLTPYQRWQERTASGRRMAAGWVSAQHTPPKRGEYEVRGHPKRIYLTWAYGHWWYMVCSDHGGIPHWHLAPGRYAWRNTRCCDNTWIHGGDLLHKAAELGSEEAKAELRALGWKGDYRPYAQTHDWRREKHS